jgi:transketolase
MKTDYREIASAIRRKIVRMHYDAQASHIGSALSCVDILVALYFEILKIDPKDPHNPGRDRFILSKGHAASALYATLAARGFFSEAILRQYCIDSGRLLGHSTKDSVEGVEVSTGSLGHGLSMSIGMSISAKYDKRNHKIYTLLSDGECDEGSVWEAAMFASHHKLDNLIAIIDYNKLQAFGRTNDIVNLEPFMNKWIAFGWAVKEIDGHNFQQIIEALKKAPFKEDKPSMVIAHTVKGKGISFMEGQLAWHYKSPSEKELESALEELGAL